MDDALFDFTSESFKKRYRGYIPQTNRTFEKNSLSIQVRSDSSAQCLIEKRYQIQ
jgi:hypothetical protein